MVYLNLHHLSGDVQCITVVTAVTVERLPGSLNPTPGVYSYSNHVVVDKSLKVGDRTLLNLLL